MPYIPEDVIDEVAVRANIVEIVQSYGVVLKQAGSRWKGCCPFHQEKTPSFMVNADSNTYHCFGCGEGGNVFKFVMKLENLDFPDAVRQLARKYNVMIPEAEVHHSFRGNNSADPSKASYSIRERLFSLHEKLADFYASYLKNNPESKAAEYFRSRQIDPAYALRFKIGAAPDSWDTTMNWALKEGFTLEELKAAHLVSESQKTPGKFFDFFRNRLIFPIWNEQGRVVGFSARQIDPEQGGGKYVNSVESPIFKKGRLLYGLNFARPDIPKKGCVVLCEGQMDVIAMHTAGCTHAVAPQGTAFGEDQAAILHRYTDTVVLATDSDSAGMKAILKDAVILLGRGFQLKVVTFPGGKDPDELLHNAGPEALCSAVDSAEDFFAFLFRYQSTLYDSRTPEGKIRIARELLRYIRLLESAVAQDSYLDFLAGKLSLPFETLVREMNRNAKEERKPPVASPSLPAGNSTGSGNIPRPEEPPSMKDPLLNTVLVELFRTALNCRAAAELLALELPPDDLDDGDISVALAALIQTHLDNDWENVRKQITLALSHCAWEADATLLEILTAETGVIREDVGLRTARDCMRRLRRRNVERQIASLKRLLLELPEGEERQGALQEF
ncbi:MAG: DNA primase, partial [Lentisphaeria bacterium]|nr:DNA primase [Lentisphaeria bacterium]